MEVFLPVSKEGVEEHLWLYSGSPRGNSVTGKEFRDTGENLSSSRAVANPAEAR